jgi:hypothetical protein
MGRHQGMPMISTSIRVSPEFHQLCIEHCISFSEAFRVGVSLILAERGLKEYDNNINLFRKMTQYRLMAEEALNKIAELEKKDG